VSAPPPDRFLTAIYDLLDFHSQLREADEDKVWSRVLDKLAAVIGVDAATYYSYLPAKNHLLPRYAIGGAASAVTTTAIDVATGICGWTARHREPALVADAYQDERFFKDVDTVTHIQTRTVMTVPLLDRLDLTGVLQFINKHSGPFTPEDLRLVVAACRATATALRSLRMESTVDRVTSHNASILENLTGGFLAMDMRGRLMLCNPAARRILSLGEEVPASTPAEKVLNHIPRLVEILTETLSTRRVVKREEFRWDFQGQARVLGYSTLLIQDPQGNLSGAGVTFQDITALKV
jgi:PAS domain S-box-containing protein